VQRDGTAAKAHVRGEVSFTYECKTAQRIVAAVVCPHAVRPLIITDGVDERCIETIEIVERFRVVGIVAARGTVFGVSDMCGELDIRLIESAMTRSKRGSFAAPYGMSPINAMW